MIKPFLDPDSPTNSLLFDPTRSMVVSDDTLDEMVDALIAHWELRTRKDSRHCLAVCLKSFWGNLELARRQQRWLAVSRDSANYTSSRYSLTGLSYRSMIRVLDYYRSLKEIDYYQGFNDRRSGVGRTSRIRIVPGLGEATPLGSQLEEEEQEEGNPLKKPFSLSRWSITHNTSDTPFSLSRLPLPELIRLKDSSGLLIDYEDTEATSEMREHLSEWNAFAQHNWPDLFLASDQFQRFRIPLTENTSGAPAEDHLDRHFVDLSARQLYRVFNNSSFEQGGRFYGGWWQGIPSSHRRFITINGHPTAEVDYSNLQIVMLYARRGHVLSEDAYQLEGVDSAYRKLVKTTLLKLINARADQNIRSAREEELPPGWSFKELCDAIYARHSPIMEDFHSGVGIFLQRWDAEIAFQVMHVMAMQNELVLPIHDSFVVKESWVERLKSAMLDAFYGYFGQEIGLSQDSLLSTTFMNPEDNIPLQIELGGEPEYYHRMYEKYRSDAFSAYRLRLDSFVAGQPFDWQLYNHGGPLW